MGNSSSTPKVTAQDKAILDLKVQRDKLKQYQKKIQVITARETSAARTALAAHNRPAALLALRRKKYQETLLSRTDAQLAQLEQLASDVEFALVQKDVIFGLQRGTEVMKEIRKEMGGVEGVERMMGRNEEERAYVEEVSEMLSGVLSRDEEEDVEDELKALEKESGLETKVEMPEVPSKGAVLPNAPAGEVTRKQDERSGKENKNAAEPLPA